MTLQSQTTLLEEKKEGFIGTSTKRIDSLQKVTGRVLYTRDMKLFRMLVARVKRSPFAHARIIRINSKRASRIPGVRAIITGADFPPANSESTPPLAQGEVLYANQSVVAVAAENAKIAEQAIDAIDVEYEKLPAVFDPEIAMSGNSPSLIEHFPGEVNDGAPNVGKHFKLRKGDFDNSIKKAPRIVEGRYTTSRDSHFQLEPLTFLAQPDADGGITLWVTNIGAHMTQFRVSRYLGMDPYLIRVKVPLLGGSFGEKQEAHMAAVCAKLALISQRSVKLELSREETMTATGARQPAIIYVKDGVDSTGLIIAREIRAIFNGGAYGAEGNFLLRNSITSASAVYDIQNVKIDAYRVYTNCIPGTIKRDPIGLQMDFAIESQMELISSELGIDPVEVRLRNVLREGSENAIGETMESISYEKCLTEVCKAIRWGKDDDSRNLKGPWRRGKGIAIAGKWAVSGIYQAMVRVRESGRIELWADIVEAGEGIYTGLSQIVATEFGIQISDVIVVPYISSVDSATTGLSQGVSGARQMVHGGKAVLLACQDAKQRIALRASEKFGWNANTIEVKSGHVYSKTDPAKKRYHFRELFATATLLYNVSAGYSLDEGFVGFGTANTPMGSLDPETGRAVGGRVSPYYASVAQGIEVSVNIETGQIKVMKIYAAQDVGKAINPELVRGQIRGCVMMGLSAALSEELVVSASDGIIANPNLADYKILTTVDAPHVEPIIIETPFKDGPYGAKGVGEASSLATGAAIRNAIHDAVGVWVNDLPITPERVLAAFDGLKVKE